MSRTLSVRIRFGYVGGSVVTGVFTTLPGLLLLPYLTDTLGVGAAVAGAVVLLPKAWDVLLTPTAGRLSDRTRGRTGNRRRYILGGGVVSAVAFALTFAGPARGATGAALTAAAFTLTATAFAFFHASYAALPADIARTPAERTSLVSARVVGVAIAALTAGAVGPAVIDAGGGGLVGHRWMGLFGAALIVIGTLGVHLSARSRGTTAPPRDTAPPAPRPWTVLRTTPGFAPFVGCTALQVVSTGCLMAGGPYFAEHVLHDSDLTGVLLAAFVLPNLISTPMWTRLGARLGPRGALRVATALFSTGCLLLMTAPALPALAPVMLFVAGIGHAGQLLFLYSMLAERCAEADSFAQGKSGALAGLFSGAESLGLALGPFLYSLALQVSGYVSSDTGHTNKQPTSAHWGVLVGMTLLPALASLAGLAVLRHQRVFGVAHPAVEDEPLPTAQARL